MHRLIRSMAAPLAAVALAGGLSLAATGAASASISPTTLYTTNGEGGYYAFGARYQRIGTVFTLTPAMEGIGTVPAADLTSLESGTPLPAGSGSGAVGTQLCDNNTGDTAQLGVLYDGGGTFTVAYAVGRLASTTPVADRCVGLGLLTDTSGTAGAVDGGSGPLDAVPVGHRVHLVVQYNQPSGHGHHGSITFTAEDATTDTNLWTHTVTNLSSLSTANPQFYEAGAGVQQDLTSVSAPADNQLVQFTGLVVRDYAGQYGDLGGGFWTAVQVESQPAGGVPLVVPSLSGSTLTVDIGGVVGA